MLNMKGILLFDRVIYNLFFTDIFLGLVVILYRVFEWIRKGYFILNGFSFF